MNVVNWDNTDLKDLYLNKKLSSVDIAKRGGCSSRAVQYQLAKLGVERRNLKEADFNLRLKLGNYKVFSPYSSDANVLFDFQTDDLMEARTEVRKYKEKVLWVK